MTTITAKDIKVGDTVKLADGNVTIKSILRRSKLHHRAMIYATMDRRAVAIAETDQVELV
jgi:hypothetical protein